MQPLVLLNECGGVFDSLQQVVLGCNWAAPLRCSSRLWLGRHAGDGPVGRKKDAGGEDSREEECEKSFFGSLFAQQCLPMK